MNESVERSNLTPRYELLKDELCEKIKAAADLRFLKFKRVLDFI